MSLLEEQAKDTAWIRGRLAGFTVEGVEVELLNGDWELRLTGFYLPAATERIVPDRLTVRLGFNDLGIWLEEEAA